MKKYLIPLKRLKRARLYNEIAGWVTRRAGSPVVSIFAFLLIIMNGCFNKKINQVIYRNFLDNLISKKK